MQMIQKGTRSFIMAVFGMVLGNFLNSLRKNKKKIVVETKIAKITFQQKWLIIKRFVHLISGRMVSRAREENEVVKPLIEILEKSNPIVA